MRKQFTFYSSFFSALSRIKKKADRADAYDIICAYALDEVEPDLDTVSDSVAIAFELLRPVLDKAKEKAENGKKGGSKPQPEDKQTASKPQANRKQTASNKEGEKEKEKEIEAEKEFYIPSPSPTEIPKVCGKPPTRQRFAAPSVQDVEAYCQDNAYAVDAQRFVDYYSANGWKVGKNSMKDWRAAVRNWAHSAQSQPQPRYGKPEMPKGASGQLGEAELEAIRRVMAQPVAGEEASYGDKLE